MAHITLSEVAEFIAAHGMTAFDEAFAHHLARMGDEHGPWTALCDGRHMDDALPCDEYEDALALAIQWLMGRIQDGA